MPGKPAVWHTPIIDKAQFTAEPTSPTGLPTSGWLAAFPSASTPQQGGAAACGGQLSVLKVVHEPEAAETCLGPGVSLCSWPFA